MDEPTMAEGCALARPAVLERFGQGAPWRRTALVAGERVAVLGSFDEPWAAQAALAGGFPGVRELTEIVEWLESNGPGPFMLTLRERFAADDRWPAAGLAPVSREPVFAVDAAVPGCWPIAEPESLVRPPHDVEEFVHAYNSWVGHESAVRQLVVADDLRDPDKVFLVLDVDGSAVGTAIVSYAAGTGYVSGIGVDPDHRRQGYGGALTRAAARAAGRAGDPVWLHASVEGSPLYRRLGFTQVDTQVTLVRPVRAG